MKNKTLLLILFLMAFLSIKAFSQAPTNGLVAYYPFSGNANDESGNNNNGTVNGAVLTNDQYNNANSAYSFDGINDYIDCGDVLDDVFTADVFSISVWFKTDDINKGGHLVTKRDGTGVNSDDMFGLWIAESKIKFELSDNSDNDFLITHSLSAGHINVWNHVVAIYDRSNTSMKIFLNGTKVSENNTMNVDIVNEPHVHLAIGAEYGEQNPGTKGNFDGVIDEVRIYNRALSDAEVQSIYENNLANYFFTNEILTFDDNQVPVGWEFVETLADCKIENGRINAYVVDANGYIKRDGAMPQNTEKLTLEWDGNIEFSEWGIQTSLFIWLGGETYYRFTHTSKGPNNRYYIYFKENSSQLYLVDENLSQIFCDVHYTVIITPTSFQFKGVNKTNNDVLFDKTVTISDFNTYYEFMEISELRFRVGATTSSNAWLDNISVHIDSAAASGDIVVTTPNSTTSWYIGQNATVSWLDGNLGGQVNIELYKGNTKVGTLASNTTNDGDWNGSLPSNLTPGTDYRIKIIHTTKTNKNDYSDYFEIKVGSSSSPPIQIIAPSQISTGSEFWVDIKVGSNSNPVSSLFGVSFVLSYSNTIFIDYISSVSGSFLGTDVVFFPTPDDQNGKVSIGISRKSGSGGVDGTGIVARVKFKVLSEVPENTTINWNLSDISANDPNGTSISLGPIPATSEVTSGILVWPGDTNNDLAVNQADILPIGLFWGKTGNNRSNASISWLGQRCQPWNPKSATFADGNGDGTVNQGDVLPIGLNWGKTHTQASINNLISNNTLKKINSGELSIRVIGDTSPGKDFSIEILANGVTNLFGISFEMIYSPALLIDPQSVEAGSWIGQDLVFFPNIDKANGKIGVGLSRKAGQGGVSGSGVLAIIKCKTSNNTSVGQTVNLNLQNIIANDPSGSSIQFNATNRVIVTNVLSEQISSSPTEFKLFPNYPNPFNPSTTITYNLPEDNKVELVVFDIRGNRVKTLVNNIQKAGSHQVIWNGTNQKGVKMPSGIYFAKITSGRYLEVRKMSLMK